ncbi:MAG: hypothetical protein HY902_12755 [Deltaproteobacteria bacterium]|nr:hypothetical protein [Deltaproteobacteria bacterium]
MMQPPFQAWLLQPGDPLPPLTLDRQLQGPTPGQWWLLALAPAGDSGLDQVAASVGGLAAVTCLAAAQDRDAAVARALGVWTGRSTLPCCVVTEPGGLVAGAWTGQTLLAALDHAAAALRGWHTA